MLKKKWKSGEICLNFPRRGSNSRSVNRAIKRFEETGSIYRRKGSGRPVTVSTNENKEIVEELAISQESNVGTHDST